MFGEGYNYSCFYVARHGELADELDQKIAHRQDPPFFFGLRLGFARQHHPRSLNIGSASPGAQAGTVRTSLLIQLMESMLSLLKKTNLQVSILMHLLICLSYLSKEEYFKVQKENCSFVERISEFVEYYSQINTSENEAAEIDKRTVLDLCAHMFHPKDVDLDNS